MHGDVSIVSVWIRIFRIWEFPEWKPNVWTLIYLIFLINVIKPSLWKLRFRLSEGAMKSGQAHIETDEVGVGRRRTFYEEWERAVLKYFLLPEWFYYFPLLPCLLYRITINTIVFNSLYLLFIYNGGFYIHLKCSSKFNYILLTFWISSSNDLSDDIA